MILIELCASGKRAYIDELDAMLALEEIRVYREYTDAEKSERTQYDCDLCSYWHLSSQEPRT